MIGHRARTPASLNFARDTKAAFTSYGSAFGTTSGRLMRFRQIPAPNDAPPLLKVDLDLLLHIEVEILGWLHQIGAVDMLPVPMF
jgi:uncharacterized glyoxalase superfamily protein PhnB